MCASWCWRLALVLCCICCVDTYWGTWAKVGPTCREHIPKIWDRTAQNLSCIESEPSFRALLVLHFRLQCVAMNRRLECWCIIGFKTTLNEPLRCLSTLTNNCTYFGTKSEQNNYDGKQGSQNHVDVCTILVRPPVDCRLMVFVVKEARLTSVYHALVVSSAGHNRKEGQYIRRGCCWCCFCCYHQHSIISWIHNTKQTIHN